MKEVTCKYIITDKSYNDTYHVELTEDQVRFFNWLRLYDLVSDEITLEKSEEHDYERI